MNENDNNNNEKETPTPPPPPVIQLPSDRKEKANADIEGRINKDNSFIDIKH